MTDMLVPLYSLPSSAELLAQLATQGIRVGAALAPEKHLVMEFVRTRFSEAWASETATTFAKTPVSCIIATFDNRVIGFSCYDAIKLNFFGPTGVDPEFRKRDIGAALLLTTLEAQKSQGYAYAVIGGAGPTEFYEKVANATLIQNSTPGIYGGMLGELGDL